MREGVVAEHVAFAQLVQHRCAVGGGDLPADHEERRLRVAAREHPHERRACRDRDRRRSRSPPRAARAVAIDDVAAAATADHPVQLGAVAFGEGADDRPDQRQRRVDQARRARARPSPAPPPTRRSRERDRRDAASSRAPADARVRRERGGDRVPTAGPPLRAPNARFRNLTPSAQDQLGDRAQRRRVGRDEQRRHDRLAPLGQVVADLRRRPDQRELLDQLARDLRAGLVLAAVR